MRDQIILKLYIISTKVSHTESEFVEDSIEKL